MMKRSIMQIVALVVLSGLGESAANGAEKNAGPGIPVGAKAPSFSLADQNGKKRSLADISGPQKKKVALVFHRSADW